MGYAIFTTRKLSLVDRIYNIQTEILNITNQKNALLDVSSAISDGEISAEDISACRNAGLLLSYEREIQNNVAAGKITNENGYQDMVDRNESEIDAQYGSSARDTATGAAVGAIAGGSIAGIIAGIASGPIGWCALAGGALCGIIGGIIGHNSSSVTKAKNEARKEMEEQYNKTQATASAEEIERELQKKENELDKRQKTLETKLTQAQNELQQVEQAEAKAIEQSTPKYAGLG